MSVVLVGWDGGFPAAPDVRIERERGDRLHAAACSDAVVIVLGSRVVREVRADMASLVLDGFGGVVFAAAPDRPHPSTEEWLDSRLATFTRADWLPLDVARVLARRPYRRLSLHDWLGDGAADLPRPMLAAFRELPRLEQLVVEEWGERLGVSPRGLRRRFGHVFPWGPGTLLRDYRLHSARMLTGSGLPMAEIAQSVGYSCASALCRALRGFRPLSRGPLLDELSVGASVFPR